MGMLLWPRTLHKRDVESRKLKAESQLKTAAANLLSMSNIPKKLGFTVRSHWDSKLICYFSNLINTMCKTAFLTTAF